ncbi:MAG: 3-isopropylmalate dehydrogenase [Pseudomonadota bacterium]|nr:3-isopropylmalate dehydrogenase [Pseudomonadota bacterium]
MTSAAIAVLPGDGIGPEVIAQAVRALQAVADRFAHTLTFETGLLGGAAIDATGEALPAATLELCRRCDAVLLGAVGGPKWSAPNARVRPEEGLLALRKSLGLFANLRPVVPHPAALDASPIKPHLLQGVDILVVRELTGGIYFGEKQRSPSEAFDVCRYTAAEIERVVRLAAGLARGRRRKLTSVDKANVLETSRLWRSVVERILPVEYPDVNFEHMLVDAAAMHVICRPGDFDVIVTENMFGDILTDETSVLAGSMGLLPSASVGESGRGGIYEPIHGSAPDIAGRGVANPYAAILSAALLLRFALKLEQEALALEAAVSDALTGGALPADIGMAAPGGPVTTHAAGEAVLTALRRRS